MGKKTGAYAFIFVVVLSSTLRLHLQDEGKRVERDLGKAVKKINAQAPIQVDEHTRIDSAYTEGHRTMVLRCTIMGLPPEAIKQAAVAIRQTSWTRASSDPGIKKLLELGVTLGYDYRLPNGTRVTSFYLGPKQQGGSSSSP